MLKKPRKDLFRSFDPVNFGDSLAKDIGSIDIGNNLGNQLLSNRRKLFLGKFNENELFKVLIKIGLIEHLDAMGFHEPLVRVNTDESMFNNMALYDKEISPDQMLIDLRLSESKFSPKEKFQDEKTHNLIYDMIIIEWLSTQNPQRNFSDERPQLPGQRRPGLGVLNFCFDMLYIVAEEVVKDGFLDIPDHLHGAIMYSKKFKFYDPVHEGVLQALVRDLRGYSLPDISWGVITKTIIDDYKNEPLNYVPSEQIFYVSDRLRTYFHSSKYRSVFEKYYKRKKYRFDYDRMTKEREKILKVKNLLDL